MRRRISLYIADNLVDLDDDSFILFNYTAEETASPSVVRNSFTRTITLKGTARNNAIFGDIFRLDRVTVEGVNFDATRKTPFVIYDEMGEILESGYVKLDKVTKNPGTVSYDLTLYGGLGSFLYGLAYDDNGDKRTLADLDFLGTANPAREFDFTINRQNVQDAWARLAGDASASDLWDTLNFAPCYNGTPSGTFDADRAMVVAESANLQTTDEEGRATRDGFVMCSLEKEYNEWETRDLRSYLQRPVLRFRRLIEALCNQDNNGGWTVNLDASFFSNANPYYNDTWLTLPILNTIDVEIDEGSGSLSWAIGSNINIPNGGNTASNYRVAIKLRPSVSVTGSPSSPMYLYCYDPNEGYYANVIRYTVRGYDSLGNLLGTSQVHCGSIRYTGTEVVMPTIDYLGHFTSAGAWVGDDVQIGIEAMGLHHIVVQRTILPFAWGNTHGAIANAVWSNTILYSSILGVSSWGQSGVSATYDYRTSSTARSGSTITKQMLLSTDKTPADYLLAFCKQFNLRFLVDKATKTVSIVERKNFFLSGVTDISHRIDRSQGIVKQPFVFDARWYDWGLAYEEGAFAQYYANVHNRVYGVRRVNTSYAFNSETKDVLDGIGIHGACEVLENGKYFEELRLNMGVTERYIPAVFLDGGKYSLYAADGTSEEYDITTPSAMAIIDWLNPSHLTYDVFPKPQFHDKDGGPIDERDTLLFFDGMKALPQRARFAVTDDTPLMMAMNDNTPCWLLDYQLTDAACAVTQLPQFSRYKWNGTQVTKSLDLGTPVEVAIPGVTFAAASDIFSQYWKSYITDRYDADTCVVTCRVDLSGLQVNEDLLRRFWWFDGAVWCLNRITNHSLTTYDLTECEFIKVQDTNNYTT